jgi:hypothetical protein
MGGSITLLHEGDATTMAQSNEERVEELMKLTLTPKYTKGNWMVTFSATGIKTPGLGLINIPSNEAMALLQLYRDESIPDEQFDTATTLISAMQATGDPDLQIEREGPNGPILAYYQGGVILVIEPIRPGETDCTKAMDRMGATHLGIFNRFSRELILKIRAERSGARDAPVRPTGMLGRPAPKTIFPRL